MKYDGWQLQLAWQNALEVRSCPDDDILFAHERNEELESHILSCKICKDKLRNNYDIDAWKKLTDLLKDSLPKPKKEIKAKSGQLWTLSRKLNGWSSGSRYYKAPMVLLIAPIEGVSCGFRVAQVYTDRLLMGPNDVWLGDSFGFAEVWNTYTVHKNDLEYCWGKIGRSRLSEVITECDKLSKNICEVSTASQYEVAEDSIIYSFRNLEVEVSSHFAMQSVPKLVYECERKPVQAVDKLLSKLKKGIKVITNSASEKILSITNPGLNILSEYFQPLKPALVTRGSKEEPRITITSQAKEYLDDMAGKFSIIPVEVNYPTREGIEIKLMCFGNKRREPSVTVSLRGQKVPEENVYWKFYNDKTGILLIKDCRINEKEIKALTAFVNVKFMDQHLQLDILPKN